MFPSLVILSVPCSEKMNFYYLQLLFTCATATILDPATWCDSLGTAERTSFYHRGRCYVHTTHAVAVDWYVFMLNFQTLGQPPPRCARSRTTLALAVWQCGSLKKYSHGWRLHRWHLHNGHGRACIVSRVLAMNMGPVHVPGPIVDVMKV